MTEMITPPFFSIVETSSHSPYQPLKIESFLSRLFPFGTWPGFQCLISKILGWYPQRDFVFKFLQAIGDFLLRRQWHLCFFPPFWRKKDFRGTKPKHPGHFQQILADDEMDGENIATEAYIGGGRVWFCFFNQCRWSIKIHLPSLLSVSLDLLLSS